MKLISLFKYLKKKDVKYVFFCLAAIVCQVWFELRVPDYMSDITKLIRTEGSTLGSVISAGARMLACALGGFAFAAASGYFAARVSAGLSVSLRGNVYGKVMNFSMAEMNGFSTSSLITRTTNDVTQVKNAVASGMQYGIKAPLMGVFAVIKIAGKQREWTIATGSAVLILAVLLSIVFMFMIPAFINMQKLTDGLNRLVKERISGVRVIRAYNSEKYECDKFEEINTKLISANIFVQRLSAVLQPGVTLVMSSLTLSIYLIGAKLIEGAAQTQKLELFSQMIVFSSYAMQVITAFLLLAMTVFTLPRAVISSRRIAEVLETDYSIIDGGTTEGQSGTEGRIEFNNVCFGYPGSVDNVLHDISFTAEPGMTVAIIGATGSGKSTLINLIPRFYDVTKGEVLVDGVNVKDFDQESLRKKIGYVSQKPILFTGTIASNVRLGETDKSLSDKEGLEAGIASALKTACADEFTDKLKDGYEASVAQGGTNFSGGQKQRLSIARAVYRRPEIYIFDDSFSALDLATDHAVRKALAETKDKNTTFIIVAQRIGTIINADKILVLNEGRIAGEGKHEELLKSSPIYREIAKSQHII